MPSGYLREEGYAMRSDRRTFDVNYSSKPETRPISHSKRDGYASIHPSNTSGNNSMDGVGISIKDDSKYIWNQVEQDYSSSKLGAPISSSKLSSYQIKKENERKDAYSGITTLKSPKISKRELVSGIRNLDLTKRSDRKYDTKPEKKTNEHISQRRISDRTYQSDSHLSSIPLRKGNNSFDSLSSDFEAINETISMKSDNQDSSSEKKLTQGKRRDYSNLNVDASPISNQSPYSSGKSTPQWMNSRVPPTFQSVEQSVWKRSIGNRSILYFEPRSDESFFVTIQCQSGTFTHHSLIPLSSTPEKWNSFMWKVFFSQDKSQIDSCGFIWDESSITMKLWLEDPNLQVRYEWKLNLVDHKDRDTSTLSLVRLQQTTFELNTNLKKPEKSEFFQDIQSNSQKQDLSDIPLQEEESMLYTQLKLLEERQILIEEEFNAKNKALTNSFQEKVNDLKIMENRLKMYMDSLIQRLPDISANSGLESSYNKDSEEFRNQYLQLVSENHSLTRSLKRLTSETEIKFKELNDKIEYLTKQQEENTNKNKNNEEEIPPITLELVEEYIDEARTDFSENIMKVAKKLGSLEDELVASNNRVMEEIVNIMYEQTKIEEKIDHSINKNLPEDVESQLKELSEFKNKLDEELNIIDHVKDLSTNLKEEMNNVKDFKQILEEDMKSTKELKQELRQEVKHELDVILDDTISDRIHEIVVLELEKSLKNILDEWIDKSLLNNLKVSIEEILDLVLEEKIHSIVDPILNQKFGILNHVINERINELQSTIQNSEVESTHQSQTNDELIPNHKHDNSDVLQIDQNFETLKNNLIQELSEEIKSEVVLAMNCIVPDSLDSIENMVNENKKYHDKINLRHTSEISKLSQDILKLDGKLKDLTSYQSESISSNEKIQPNNSNQNINDSHLKQLQDHLEQLDIFVKQFQSTIEETHKKDLNELKSIISIIQEDVTFLQSDNNQHKQRLEELREYIPLLSKDPQVTKFSIQEILESKSNEVDQDTQLETQEIVLSNETIKVEEAFENIIESQNNLVAPLPITLTWSNTLKQAEIEIDTQIDNTQIIKCDITDKRYPMSILSDDEIDYGAYLQWKIQIKNWNNLSKIWIGICDPHFSFSNFIGYFSRSWSLELLEGKYYNGEYINQVLNRQLKVGDIITFEIDLRVLPGTFGICINDEQIEIVSNNIYPPLSAAITFEGQGELINIIQSFSSEEDLEAVEEVNYNSIENQINIEESNENSTYINEQIIQDENDSNEYQVYKENIDELTENGSIEKNSANQDNQLDEIENDLIDNQINNIEMSLDENKDENEYTIIQKVDQSENNNFVLLEEKINENDKPENF